jgi:FtsP/CotA-like multicopper oxidase with cupredoxin domain
MHKLFLPIILLICVPAHRSLHAQETSQEACPRPAIGSEVPEPSDLRSTNGVLSVELSVRNQKEKDGSMRYCYIYGDGIESPNLRLKPGDLLILKLKNDLIDPGHAPAAKGHQHAQAAATNADPCQSSLMNATSTNLHFQGLTVPPVCHQDDVLKTSVQPTDTPFEYSFRIPANEPPGLY